MVSAINTLLVLGIASSIVVDLQLLPLSAHSHNFDSGVFHASYRKQRPRDSSAAVVHHNLDYFII